MTPFAELTIGTATRPSRERLRTVVDGCERLGNVERTHPQPPDPQSETGTLATHSGKMRAADKPWICARAISGPKGRRLSLCEAGLVLATVRAETHWHGCTQESVSLAVMLWPCRIVAGS